MVVVYLRWQGMLMDGFKFFKKFRFLYAPFATKLRQWAQKNYNVMFVLKILRRSHNKLFRQYVTNFEFPVSNVGRPVAAKQCVHRIRNLQVHELGPKNTGKIVMLMNNKAGSTGFCALWIYYLNRLSFSDKMGFYHVFNCTESEVYQENHPIHGTRNVFEYYFQQPCGISLKSAWKSKSVIFDCNCDDYGFFDSFHVGGSIDYTFTDKDIEDFAELQRKYIRLQPHIKSKIDKQIHRLIDGHKVLAVHARGTDFKVGYKGHPIVVEPQEYLYEALKMAEKIGADRIFLATDDETFLNVFEEALGEKLLYYKDVIRSSGTVWNCCTDPKAKNQRYRLGFEIVRDVYTMAACSGFVCGMSYVGFMVQVVKKSQGVDFEDFLRVFYGLRRQGVDLTSAEERARVGRKWREEKKMLQKRKENKMFTVKECT